MAKHNVRQTKGQFKIVGKAFGAKSDRLFKETTFDNGRTKNQVSFGIHTSDENECYISLDGYDADKAKFNKWDSKLKKSFSKEVDWDNRFDFEEDGYAPTFGVRIGMELDPKNKPVISQLFQFDACEEVRDKLVDDMPLYIEGNISFSSYTKGEETKKYKNFVPTKIYRQSSDIDFKAEGFTEENRFEQEIIFMGIEQEKDYESGKSTGRFIVSAKVVTYKTVEDVEFIIEDKSLAGKIKSGLKPYWSINCLGRLVTKVEKDDDNSSDGAWGDDEDMQGDSKVKFREMVITKAYPNSIDKETYSEEVLASITQAEEDFGASATSEESGDEVWD